MRVILTGIGLALASCTSALASSEADRAACDYPAEKPSEAIRACSDIIDTLDVGYVLGVAYLNRGIAYIEKGEFDRAIADFDEALQLDPEQAEVYFNRGIAYREKHDYDNAIADFDWAIRLNAGDADAYNNRGSVFMSKGDYDRAVADFDEALRIDPLMKAAAANKALALAKRAGQPAPR